MTARPISESEIAALLHKHRWKSTLGYVYPTMFACTAGCKFETNEPPSQTEARHQAAVIVAALEKDDE